MNAKKRPTRFAHCEGHTSVNYSEDGEHIFTCGCEGDVRIWSGLEDDDAGSVCAGERALTVAHKGDHFYVGTDNLIVQAYTFPGLDRDGIICRFTAAVTHIDISDDAKMLVAGSSDMEIKVNDLATSNTFTLSGHKAPVFGVSLDPKKEYLASSSGDGTVRIWAIQSKETVQTWNCVPTCNDFFSAKCLGRCSWQPKTGDLLAVPHGKEIQMFNRTTWNKHASLSNEDVTQDFSIAVFSPCGKFVAGSTISGDICVWSVKTQGCTAHVRNEFGYTVTGLAWNPTKSSGEIAFCDVMGHLGTVVDCIPTEQEVITLEDEPQAEDEMVSVEQFIQLDDDDDDDDENVISVNKIKAEASQSALGDLNMNEDVDDDLDSKMSVVAPPALMCDLQPPFQPSSTPVHLQHRFMVWNSVGIVRCYNTEDENSIDVEFHDSSYHHALHIANYMKHTLATLTEEVLVLACEVDDDAPSKVVCVLINAWDGTKEWTVDLPEGEEALAVAAGQGWVAVATDTRSLRLFTAAGSQREVVALPGPVVCLAGHKSRLLAVYHCGMGLPGDQNLGFVVFSVGSGPLQAITTFQPLALTPKSTLRWAGFSDEGTPFTQDSAGIVRMFARKGYWLPACDTQSQCKGKSDHYFVIGISEKYQNIRCVLCKGAHYPPTTPRPAVNEISLQLPLCEAESEKSVLEEKFWRSQIISSTFADLCKTEPGHTVDKDILDRAVKETVIKMFALACRSDLDLRALELCNLMPSHKVIQLAMMYASRIDKMHLADKVSEVAQRKMEESSNGYEDYSTRSTWEKEEAPPIYSRSASADDNVDGIPQANGHSEHVAPDPESLLLVAKQRKSEVKPGVLKQDSSKRLNPFKKAVVKTEGGKALDNLNASYIQQQQNKNKKNNALLEQTPPPQPKAKQTKLTTPNSSEGSAKKTMSFFEWFEKEKKELQEEFPDLSTSELSRTAMKRYKELLKSNQLPSTAESKATTNSPQTTESTMDTTVDSQKDESENPKTEIANTETKKRKLNDEFETEVKKPAKKTPFSSSKLSAFAFKKSKDNEN